MEQFNGLFRENKSHKKLNEENVGEANGQRKNGRSDNCCRFSRFLRPYVSDLSFLWSYQFLSG